MKLYEYDEAIESAFDPETGEIDEARVEALLTDYNTRVKTLMCIEKDEDSDIEALKVEERKLAERRRAKENRRDRIRAYLAFVLNGKKFECPEGRISFRRTSSVEIINKNALIVWAEEHGQDQIVSYKEPDISKTELKRLIDAKGPAHVPEELATVVTRQSMIIK